MPPIHLLADGMPVDTVSLGALGTFLTGIGAIIMTFVKRADFKAAGRKEAEERNVNIQGQPLAVKMEDHFVTRREFENLEGRIRTDIVEMKSMFRETMTVIERRDKSLSEKIESVASGAYEARRRIHDKLNDQGERLKSLEDRTPVKRAS